MADIRLSLVNQALTHIGEDLISSLSDGGFLSDAAIENYEAFVLEEIETGNWAFALKFDPSPTLLTETRDPPLQYVWQIPADCITLEAVLWQGQELTGDWEAIEGRKVRCFFNEEITFRYLYRADESLWPERFKRIIVQRLEALFLRATERHTEADTRDQATEVKKIVAKHTESAQRGNRPLGAGSLVDARRGFFRQRNWNCP